MAAVSVKSSILRGFPQRVWGHVENCSIPQPLPERKFKSSSHTLVYCVKCNVLGGWKPLNCSEIKPKEYYLVLILYFSQSLYTQSVVRGPQSSVIFYIFTDPPRYTNLPLDQNAFHSWSGNFKKQIFRLSPILNKHELFFRSNAPFLRTNWLTWPSSQGNWKGQCPPVEYIELKVARLSLILERWYDCRHDFVILFF